MSKKIMLTIIAICVIILFTGCKNGKPNIDIVEDIDSTSFKSGEKEDSSSGERVEEFVETLKEEVYKYNESGKIIIVMYHKFADVETDEYSRSFDNFRKDLEYLYELGYRSVSLNDYLSNSIKVPVRMYANYIHF